MYQISFALAEHEGKKRKTKRQKFLAEMEKIVPWNHLLETIEPWYPKGKRGRPPIGLERMLRLYFVQQWYGLADEAVEDAVSDSAALRAFVRIDLGREEAPDATTLLKFRHMLEEHKLGKKILEQINAHLSEQGLLMREGTMVDATIINAPSSTKNRDRARDPEMHQTKKGNQWFHGMKAHIGADRRCGVVHSTHYTAANESDIAHAHEVLHGQEEEVHLDAGYTGIEKREEILQAQASGDLRKDIKFTVAMKRSVLKGMAEGGLKELTQALERVKAQIRARVEHPFHIVKNIFKHKKTRYRGLKKNGTQLDVLFGLANLVITKKDLLMPRGQCACMAG